MAVRITGAGVALTVGIIAVTGLIIGGFYLAKNAGEQARREDDIQLAEESLNSGDVAVNDNESSENSGSESGDSSTNSDTSTDDSTSEGGSSSTGSTGSSSGSNGGSESTGGSSSTGSGSTSNGVNSGSSSSATELPQTGPVDTLATLVVLGLVSYAAGSYVLSRRNLQSL